MMTRALAEQRVSVSGPRSASVRTTGATKPATVIAMIGAKTQDPKMTVPDGVLLLAVMGHALTDKCLPEYLRGLSFDESRKRMLLNFKITSETLDALIKIRRLPEGVFKVGPILTKAYITK